MTVQATAVKATNAIVKPTIAEITTVNITGAINSSINVTTFWIGKVTLMFNLIY